VLALAAESGFRWFATDESVLGRMLNIGFGRDASGLPSNADRLYTPLELRTGRGEARGRITGFFRDHYLSDLVGFVYGRMDPAAAAEDLHRRLREAGERVRTDKPLTVSVILDGENAWEYYAGNGREFLRQFYGRVQRDGDIRALTASEALAAAGDLGASDHIFPGSWINANFDIWIGHDEDVAGWRLLRDARDFYAEAAAKHERGEERAPSREQLAAAYEALLAAEGSDWFWWFGPENSSANDAEFDAFFRKLVSEVYRTLNSAAPDELANPIKRQPVRAEIVPPSSFLAVSVDGRETNYFEWLGAGLYSPDQRESAMHGRTRMLRQLRYGFNGEQFYLCVDVFDDLFAELCDAELRVTFRSQEQGRAAGQESNGEGEVRIHIYFLEGKLAGYRVEARDFCLIGPSDVVQVACGSVLELSIARRLLRFDAPHSFWLATALWEGGLPVDALPREGVLEVRLGEEHFAWPVATEK
jgi:hypothetical protein